MANALHDQNHVPTLTAASNAADGTIVTLYADPVTHRLLVSSGGGGGGTPGGLNTQLQYNNAGSFGGITGAVTDGTAVSLTGAHLLNPTINGIGAGLATLVYPNTATSVSVTLPIANDTLVGKATTDTFTNKRLTRRLIATTQSATPTINTDNTDISNITALAQAITSFTTNLSGAPVDGDFLEIRITDNGTARALSFGASFGATTVALPTTTVISTMLRVLFEWNNAASLWQCIAVA